MQAFLERAPDDHRFANAFHLRGERGGGLRKFLKGKTLDANAPKKAQQAGCNLVRTSRESPVMKTTSCAFIMVSCVLLSAACVNAIAQVLFFDNFEQFGNGTDLTSANYTPASGPASASVITSVQNGSPTIMATNNFASTWAFFDNSVGTNKNQYKGILSSVQTNQPLQITWKMWIKATNSGPGMFLFSVPVQDANPSVTYNPLLGFLDTGAIIALTNGTSPLITIGNWSSQAGKVMTNTLILNYPSHTISYALNGVTLTNLPLGPYFTNVVNAIYFNGFERSSGSLGNRFAIDEVQVKKLAASIPLPLAIANLGDQVQLSWPSSLTDYEVQWNTNFATAAWREDTHDVVWNDNWYYVSIPIMPPARFFRLVARDPFTNALATSKLFEFDDNLSDGILVDTNSITFIVSQTGTTNFNISFPDFSGLAMPVSLVGDTLRNQTRPLVYPTFFTPDVLFMSDGVNKLFAFIGQETNNPLDISFAATCWTEASGTLTANNLAGTWALHGYRDASLVNTNSGFDVLQSMMTITTIGQNQISISTPEFSCTASISGMEAHLDNGPLTIGGRVLQTLKLASNANGLALYWIESVTLSSTDASVTILLGTKSSDITPH